MGTGGTVKTNGKNLVWEKAWRCERKAWKLDIIMNPDILMFDKMLREFGCLCWWRLTDMKRIPVWKGEIMAKIVAGCSKLKSHDYRYKTKGIEKICGLYDILADEDSKHMIMQCEATLDIRVHMFEEIGNIDQDLLRDIMKGDRCYEILLGANPDK